MATGGFCDEIMCALCLEVYREPKLLPCYHTFCKTCIEQLIQKSEVEGNFSCPLCRSTINIKSDFPSNIYIQTHLSFQGESVKCELCECETNVKTKCIDCNQILCDGCSSFHLKIKTCKNHQVVEYITPVNELKTPLLKITKTSYCPKHPEEVLRFYCIQCDMAVCRDCKYTTHEGHKSEDVQDRIHDATKWMESYCQKLDFELSCCNNQLTSMVNLKDIMNSNNLNMVQCLQKLEQDICKEIKERCAELKLEMKRLSDEQIMSIMEGKTEIESEVNKLTSKRKYINQIVLSGPGSDIVQCKSQFSKFPHLNVDVKHFRHEIPTFYVTEKRPKVTLGQIKQKPINLGLTLVPKSSFLCNVMNKSVAAICLKSADEALVSFRSDTWDQGSRQKNVVTYSSDGIEKGAYVMPYQLDLVVDSCKRVYFYEDRLGGITVYERLNQDIKNKDVYNCRRPVSIDMFGNGDLVILNTEKKLSRIDLVRKRKVICLIVSMNII